jgi:hypothetical protein
MLDIATDTYTAYIQPHHPSSNPLTSGNCVRRNLLLRSTKQEFLRLSPYLLGSLAFPPELPIVPNELSLTSRKRDETDGERNDAGREKSSNKGGHILDPSVSASLGLGTEMQSKVGRSNVGRMGGSEDRTRTRDIPQSP